MSACLRTCSFSWAHPSSPECGSARDAWRVRARHGGPSRTRALRRRRRLQHTALPTAWWLLRACRLVIFLVVFNGIVNNQELPRFVRFNAMQAVLLDVLLM